MEGHFYGGTSGLQISMPKRDFSPEHAQQSRLTFYGHHENSIEINSSFCKIPQARSVSRWVAEVPGDFRFTFKLWKEITHQKNLLFQTGDVNRYMEALAGATAKKGCLLVQFPPSLQVSAFLQLQELILKLSNKPQCSLKQLRELYLLNFLVSIRTAVIFWIKHLRLAL